MKVYNVKPSNSEFSILLVRGRKLDEAKTYIKSLNMIPVISCTDGVDALHSVRSYINPSMVNLEVEDNVVINVWIG